MNGGEESRSVENVREGELSTEKWRKQELPLQRTSKTDKNLRTRDKNGIGNEGEKSLESWNDDGDD